MLHKNTIVGRSIDDYDDDEYSGLGILPAKTPQMIVDIRGVLVVALIFDKNLKSRPSLAIAYKIRGSGNIAPKRLQNGTH